MALLPERPLILAGSRSAEAPSPRGGGNPDGSSFAVVPDFGNAREYHRSPPRPGKRRLGRSPAPQAVVQARGYDQAAMTQLRLAR